MNPDQSAPVHRLGVLIMYPNCSNGLLNVYSKLQCIFKLFALKLPDITFKRSVYIYKEQRPSARLRGCAQAQNSFIAYLYM